jgi:chromosome segregation ATPase
MAVFGVKKGGKMKLRHVWIVALLAAASLSMLSGCSSLAGNSAEMAEELQGVQATLTAIRAQLAQNRARIEALERSQTAYEASSEETSMTATSQGVDAAVVRAIQDDLTSLSARIAEMEIIFSEMNERMRQMPAGMRPGG